jgi:hypothetical protein
MVILMSNNLPLTLAAIGHHLWGARWMEPMAAALAVTEREIVQWDVEPEMMPSSVKERIRTTAEMRMQEIEDLLTRLDHRGVKSKKGASDPTMPIRQRPAQNAGMSLI